MNKNLVYIGSGIVLSAIGLIVWQRKKVSLYAKKFIGYTEKSGNSGFSSPEFQQKMIDAGWSKGQSWCMYFAKVVWLDKYKTHKDILEKLLTGSTIGTYENLKKDNSGLFDVSLIPKIGNIVIWQTYSEGTPQYRGHAGIVTKVSGDEFETVEGNTNDSGSREGYIVAEKKHSISKEKNKTSGLRLLAFIHKK